MTPRFVTMTRQTDVDLHGRRRVNRFRWGRHRWNWRRQGIRMCGIQWIGRIC
jgi:hypothetical protein